MAARSEVVPLTLPVVEAELSSGMAVLDLDEPATADVVAGFLDGLPVPAGRGTTDPPASDRTPLGIDPC